MKTKVSFYKYCPDPFIMIKTALTFLLFAINTVAWSQSAFDRMTNEKMQKILYREAEEVKGQPGNWQFKFRERRVYIITDQDMNRMRIISPIIEEKELKEKDMKLLLEANFDKALDAKYSLFDGILWASFTHPLGELGVEQLKDAMKQVTELVNNYGTTYTSTSLVFGGGEN
ncbi:MAG: hypothetical protein KI790_08135 [Cyclobacteriaceae bacterium]|nr:hypothetical protein [Cyclobacteriaceae bacterium HetDA_MAG_MS6]